MANRHSEHPEVSESVPSVPSVAQYNDGDIVTMRIGGYLGCLPYRQYPEMDASENRAHNVGRRYLAERAAQTDLAKFRKDNPHATDSEIATHLATFLANWKAPAGDSNEFTTVGSMRAEIAAGYIRENWTTLGGKGDPDSAAGKATIAKYVSPMLAHPKHGAVIAARLAAKFAEYIAPKKREDKGAVDSSVETQELSLDAA